MSLLSRLRGAFDGRPEEAEEYATVDSIFQYLLGRINETDAALQKKVVAKAQSVRGKNRARVLLRAYFELEHFVVSHTPPLVDDVYSEQKLRDNIRGLFGDKPLPNIFKLVFMPPTEQLFEVCTVGIQHLTDFLVQYADVSKAKEALVEVTHGTPLEKIMTEKGIDFEMMRKIHMRTSTSIALAQYKQIYRILFDTIGTLFGKPKAIDLCKQDYEWFKINYDKNITAQFLSILPESVLELEQLAFMSREELERQISERTEQLRILNDQLEKKVLDRTQELKQNVDALAAANKHLLELDQVKTEFVSVAAHQLRTPLTAVKWMFSLLLDADSSNLTDKQKDLISKGSESNERMIKLVNDLLTVTNIESGNIRYNLSSVSMEDLIHRVLFDFAGQAQGRMINLTFEKPEAPLPAVQADPEKLQSVLQSLIENALAYSKNGSTIQLYAKPEGAFVKTFVKDSGIGIPADQQIGIFDKFFRADNAMSMRPNGSGLGLFMAKRIVARHGGTIGFESTEGKGSTFYFTIPLATDTQKTSA